MKSTERDKALKMRIDQQLGYAAIAKELHVAKSTVSRWLKDIPLSAARIRELRRHNWSKGEASREVFRQTMRKKREQRDAVVYQERRKHLGDLSKQSLFVAGLMLYLAEGDKKEAYRIGLANTDPEVVSFFIWWLGEFLEIPRHALKIQLHLYESMDIKKEKAFWRGQTKLRTSQFYKDQIRPLRPGSFSYRESFRHGTCKVYAYGRENKSALTLSIRAFLDTYNGLRS